MPCPYDVYIKSAKPLVTQPEEEDGARPCTLRLGQKLIATHRELIESLPALSELAAQQDSIDTVSLSSLLKYQPCLTPDGVKLLLDFVYGKEAYVKPKMVAEILAAANALRVDDLISQIENELMRLAGYDAAVTRLDTISTHGNFGKILWPTFEMLMKYAIIDSTASVFMNAFITWVNVNRHDQTLACSLLLSSKFHELTVVEKEEFAQRSAFLYLHGVSSAMSKLTGSAPFTEKRILTHRWSTSSDLSISSSVDVVAIHEEPFTNTNITVDCSQLREYGQIYSDIEDSIVDSFMEEEESEECYDDNIQEEHSFPHDCHFLFFSQSSQYEDFGTIPIPDGDLKQIQLSIELDDDEQALDYIRKMRFHFDMEVDPKNFEKEKKIKWGEFKIKRSIDQLT